MRRLFTENLGIKISALLIALFLWFFVTSRGQSEIPVEVPVEFKNIPAGLGIVNSSHKTAVVNVRGQERMMKNLKSANIRVMVDLSKSKKGEGTFHINKDDIKLPYAMSVTTVSPSALRVRMDETDTRTLAVKPNITGQPEKGFTVSSVEVEPGTVSVSGLKSEVRKLQEIKTELLDITGLNESTVQDLDIDTSRTNITLDTKTVKITVTITGRKR